MGLSFSGKTILFSGLLFTTIAFFSPHGFAYQKGDTLVRAGTALIDPREDSDSREKASDALAALATSPSGAPPGRA